MKETIFEARARAVSSASDRRTGLEVEAGSIERFVDRKRKFFEVYVGDASVEILTAEGVMTPEGPLETCAIDLEGGKMYLHPRFLDKVYGGSETRLLFGACHEFEHFRELRSLLREPGGAQVWQDHRRKIERKQRYHILDNSFGDVKMNRTVVTRAPSLAPTRRELYTENLFPERDLSGLPKHLQFAHILNCEQQDTGETWTVTSDVREAFEQLQAKRGKSGVGFLEYAAHPETPMSTRLWLQEAVIEPVYERFFEEDVEKKRQAESDRGQSKQGSEERKEGGNGKQDAGEQEKDGEEESEKGELPLEKTGDGAPSPADAAGGTLGNPEDFFRDEYAVWEKRFRHATPDDVINQAVEKEIVRQVAEAQAGDRTGDRAFEAYAAAQGVTSRELRVYRRFLETVEQIENPETNEQVIEELRSLFEQIITRRKKRLPAPRYPLPEGDLLAYPAEVVVRSKAGESEPDVWEDVEFREREDKCVGDFDVTVVGDISGSMEGEKAVAQRLAIALVLEALTEFSDELEDRRADLSHDLHVRTEGWVFGDRAECVKALSEELSERERVAVYKRLGSPNGQSTKDFLVLETLLENLSDEEREKLDAGKRKKIVIVMTDGESSDTARVQAALGSLRASGVIVIGVGLTEDGRAALTTYAPEAKLCERVEDLAVVLTDLLKEHLANL
ncbi:MAG: vWA domain-containing protein [Candidatus Moraniibacteriota bacterium]